MEEQPRRRGVAPERACPFAALGSPAAGYKPGTWVTLHAGSMGDTCAVHARRTTVHGQRRLVDALVGDGGGGAARSVSARLRVRRVLDHRTLCALRHQPKDRL